MNRKIISILALILLPASGFALWKIFSQPLPLPDQPQDSAVVNSKPEAKSTFPELHIGGEVISPGDIEWEFALHTSLPRFVDSDEHFGVPKATPDPNEGPIAVSDSQDLRERIISGVIERKILFHYIKNKTTGINLDDPARFQKCLSALKETTDSNPEFFSHRRSHELLKTKLCEEDIVKQYLDEFVFKSLVVTPEEASSYYRKNEKSYKKPLRVILRQVVVADEAKAHDIKKEIKQNNFAILARKYSITPEADNGGLIGPFSKEQLPTLFDIVFSMGIGDISGVVKSEYGYHILMPIERLPPQTQHLAEVSSSIRAELLRAKKMEAFQKWLNVAMNSVSVSSPNSGVNP